MKDMCAVDVDAVDIIGGQKSVVWQKNLPAFYQVIFILVKMDADNLKLSSLQFAIVVMWWRVSWCLSYHVSRSVLCRGGTGTDIRRLPGSGWVLHYPALPGPCRVVTAGYPDPVSSEIRYLSHL